MAISWVESAFKENDTNKVLIHCFAGKSRAATITLAYLMKSLGMTLREGLDRVLQVRPIVAPNQGFM